MIIPGGCAGAAAGEEYDMNSSSMIRRTAARIPINKYNSKGVCWYHAVY